MAAKPERGSYKKLVHEHEAHKYQWGPEKYAHILEVYSFFDKDNDGAITTSQVIKVVRSLGYNPAEKDVVTLLQKVDPEGEGMIEFTTFLQLLADLPKEGDSAPEIEEAFRVLDVSGTGVISSSELRTMLTQLGEKLSEEEAEDMIVFADGGSRGEIHWRDLMQALLNE